MELVRSKLVRFLAKPEHTPRKQVYFVNTHDKKSKKLDIVLENIVSKIQVIRNF